MSSQVIRIFKLGENAWTIQWQLSASRELLQLLLAVKENLNKAFEAEIIHSYTEIIIKRIHAPSFSDADLEIRFREIIQNTTPLGNQKTRVHHIPVCYERPFGEDIDAYLKATSLSLVDVMEIHTKPLYTVYFMGFLPGFPYLDGLDKRLHLERKSTPSQIVKQGSVAIGGTQTGIYPQDSPGGWYTIGHSPITLFDVTSSKPSPFKAGDYIKFYAIDALEHQRLKEQALQKPLFPKTELYEG